MATAKSTLTQRLMWIVWPAFLISGVMEMLVFALVDPEDLHWFGHSIDLSRQGVYAAAFFVFWFLICLSGALTALLAMSPAETNKAE